jgi:aspartate racemase
MKAIGLIGGMSWESTVVYYQQINRLTAEQFGGLRSAPIRLHSFDFAHIVTLQQQGKWQMLADKLSEAARGLEQAGASCVAICTNTMHKVAPEVQDAVSIPLVDIRDAVGQAAYCLGMRRVGLLGTRYTMEQEFFRAHLCQKWDLEVMVPAPHEMDVVHDVIFGELCQGIVRPESRVRLIALMEQLAERGAEGIILGCTELMLLLDQRDSPVPLLDTTTLHSQALVDFAMRDDCELLNTQSSLSK